MSRRLAHRTGKVNVQFVILAALIVCGIFGTVAFLGTKTNTKLQQTGSDLANPANLTQRFGS